ncbi:hypothetical protein [Microvirga flavescens]|uniref:hypothetical protein n=1 Tax=Microvirga flavescens TaxID=2249811 RepID=UPI000DD77166|nr:hypothetical protein [Microvirga flavescens]
MTKAISRRALVSIASAAALPVGCVPVSVLASEPHPDAQLLNLKGHFDEVLTAFQAADAKYVEAKATYQRLCGPMPRELAEPIVWRWNGPHRLEKRTVPWDGVSSQSSDQWTVDGLQRLVPRWEATGAEYADLVSKARNLLIIAERWETAKAKARIESRLSYWYEQQDSFCGPLSDLVDDIRSLIPKTVEGLAVHAHATKQWGFPYLWTKQDAPAEDGIAHNLVLLIDGVLALVSQEGGAHV